MKVAEVRLSSSLRPALYLGQRTKPYTGVSRWIAALFRWV